MDENKKGQDNPRKSSNNLLKKANSLVVAETDIRIQTQYYTEAKVLVLDNFE